jgi:hypothetical protein
MQAWICTNYSDESLIGFGNKLQNLSVSWKKLNFQSRIYDQMVEIIMN